MLIKRYDAGNPVEGKLNLGTKAAGIGPGGVIGYNSRFLTMNGKPWFPVMGEFHFTRYPQEEWEKEILKMKAAGLDAIATYIFWIFHEEEEGVFVFEGDRDVRCFLELCKKHGMKTSMRIGPWCHGEARNGGFPDWLLEKGIPVRTNDPEYPFYAERLYRQYAKQMEGMYWKDGGPIFMVQVENELVANGEHLAELKRMAQACGMDAPVFSVTGWNGDGVAQFPAYEMLPLFGGYPEAPWTQNTDPLPPITHYMFVPGRSDGTIGSDQIKTGQATQCEEILADYPFGSCEVGPGVQMTHHRRPVILPKDVYASNVSLVGKGSNLIGYYVFHGGRNPDGHGGLYNESLDSGYPNDVPVSSYDFQAPLSEYGFARESLKYLRLLHSFVHMFGDALPDMTAFYAEEHMLCERDNTTPRMILRCDSQGSGFVFINTYQRITSMEPIREETLFIENEVGERVDAFGGPLDIPADVTCVFPVNMKMGDFDIACATVQPVMRKNGPEGTTLFFAAIDGVPASITLAGEKRYDIAPARRVAMKKGNTSLVVLSFMDALRLQQLGENVYLSDDLLTEEAGGSVFGEMRRAVLRYDAEAGLFAECLPAVPHAEADVRFEPQKISMRFHRGIYTKYLFCDNLADCPEYRLSASRDIFEKYADVRLRFNAEGDVIHVYDGEKLVADAYNTGEIVEMGLRRFKDAIEAGRPLTVKISPLGDKKVYLERNVSREKTQMELLEARPVYIKKLEA